MKVIKRDGSIHYFNIDKIKKQTSEAVEGLKNVSQEKLDKDIMPQLRDGIKSSDIQSLLITTALNKIDIDSPDWTFVASRLFMNDLYHQVGKKYNSAKGQTYSHSLKEYIQFGQAIGRIIDNLEEGYNLEELDSYIQPSRDKQFTYLGAKTLYDRYLLKDRNHSPIELPQHMFMAVAMFLAQNEENKMKRVKEFYDVISKFEVMVATPTLSNARTPHHQLSSCFLGSTGDNIESIFDTYKDMALLSKHGGGIGWDFSKVRGSGATIRGHKGVGGGVIPFLKPVNDIALAVDQLGCVDRDSYVKVLDFVRTKDFKHQFFSRKKRINSFSGTELDNLVDYAKSFAFEYGNFSKEFITNLIENSIRKVPVEKSLEQFGINRQQYKKVMGQYRKVEKTLPKGFRFIQGFPYYAINEFGLVISSKTLKPLTQHTDLKGYATVTLGKISKSLHTLLYRNFISEYDSTKLTIDHIDENKLNNSLENFKLLTNEENVSKGWEDLEKRNRRIEKSKVRKYITGSNRLNGDKRGWNTEILETVTKTIPITETRIGDLILSFNTQTGKTEYQDIDERHEVFVKHSDQISIKYEDGNYITTSNWHPLAILEDRKYIYKRSDEVQVGDIGVNENGKESKILEIDNNPKTDENYFDLSVKENNNYFCSTKNSDGAFHLIHNTRKGSINAYLEIWHWDIEDFLDLKKNSGEERRRTHDLFTSIWINDLFMERVKNSGSWTLFDPHETMDLTDSFGDKFKKLYLQYENNDSVRKNQVSAKELWQKILLSYFETGSPFLGFKDESNRRNPNQHSGIIRSSNLCMEILQNTNPHGYELQTEFIEKNEKIEEGETAVCNLASINLSKINKTEDIERVVPTAIRMLDNVIDLNYYPIASTKHTNIKNRAIGLGVMGEAQMLAEAYIEFGTDKHFQKIDEILENVSFNVIQASSNLAKEKGKYPSYKGSLWSQGIFPIDTAHKEAEKLVTRKKSCDWDKLRKQVKTQGMRNGYLMAIAPTSSISILTGTTQTVEPVYKKKWLEENLSGMIPVTAPNLNSETWFYYKSVYEVSQEDLVKAGAIRQKWIDQSQSLNIFVNPDTITGGQLHRIYMLAWNLGVKTTYYLRSKSPEVDEAVDRSDECLVCQ